jgi:2,4-dienoyl-CoA reductase-like NADH-dependent reductase (Old Yellow Enzyme family)
MAVDLLLREGRINGMKTRNRIHCGPAERSLANRDGSMTQRYIDFLAARAKGGAGLITVESSYVDHRGMGHHYPGGCPHRRDDTRPETAVRRHPRGG